MTYAIADCRISKETEKALLDYADKIIKLPPLPSLASPVASHPDMLMWCHGKALVTYEKYFLQERDIFGELEAAGLEIILSNDLVKKEYPYDVHLNCAAVGKALIANKNYISPEIAKICARVGMEILHVRQGYAKCSCAVVGESALITSDASIAAAAAKSGIDVLSVSAGHVRLDGYDTGFIGGASGMTENAVLFCGSLDTHPDGEKIKEFCQKHGKRAVSLSDEPLYDYGTVFFISC